MDYGNSTMTSISGERIASHMKYKMLEEIDEEAAKHISNIVFLRVSRDIIFPVEGLPLCACT